MKAARGFQSMRDANSKRDAEFQSRGQFIRWAYQGLRDDGDMMRMRIVTDGSEEGQALTHAPEVMLHGDFHRIPKISKGGKTYYESLIVPAHLPGATDKCQYCTLVEPIRLDSRFMLWVYVYAYYHRSPNPKQGEEPWKMVKLGGMTMYKQPVDAFALWYDGFHMSQRLDAKLTQHGTLCDRDYVVTRYGSKNSTNLQRDLQEAGEKSPIPEAMLVGAAQLPNLDDVASGAVTTMDGAKVGETSTIDTSGANTTPSTHSEVSLGEPEVEVESFGGGGASFEEGEADPLGEVSSEPTAEDEDEYSHLPW